MRISLTGEFRSFFLYFFLILFFFFFFFFWFNSLWERIIRILDYPCEQPLNTSEILQRGPIVLWLGSCRIVQDLSSLGCARASGYGTSETYTGIVLYEGCFGRHKQRCADLTVNKLQL